MLTRSRIIAGASGLAGEPPNEPLPGGVPEWLRYEIAADMESELMRDMNLSTENRMMSSYPVNLQPGKRDFTISQSGLENAAYVSMTIRDSSNTVPLPIEIGNVATLDGSARDGRRVIAFYDDNPQRAIVSWNPTGNERLLIWYDRSPETDPSADEAQFTINSSYVPLLKLLLAAQMLELMKKNLKDFPMLQSRITRGMEQWGRFVTEGKQAGIIQKTAYRPGRYGRNASQWDAWPGRVAIE